MDTEIKKEILQSALGAAHDLPSIFEVLAQDNLNKSVKPALHYLCKFIVGNFPEKLDWLMIWFDEIFLAFDLFIQHHFLVAHSASFAEKYYSIQRVKWDEIAKSYSLISNHNRGYHLSILSLAVLPYIAGKLKKLYQSTEEVESQTQRLTKFGKIVNFLYPSFYTIWQFSKLYFQLSFAVKKSKYHDPLHKIMKIKLISQSSNDFQSSSTISGILTQFISGGVHACVFGLQFIQWWYTDANQAQVRKVTQGQIPPPPKKLECVEAKRSNQCPLCKKEIANSTALATSGFVFCYLCILRYIDKNGNCPVTKVPSHRNQLIKLYPPEDQ